MTLSAPAAISIIGDAQIVRHLRAGGKSWAVWVYNDDGGGHRFAVRERSRVISFVPPVTGLRTDGTDFSERVIPLPPMAVRNFHCLELATNQVAFLFGNGTKIFSFLWHVITNTIITPVTDEADGDLPAQFEVNQIIRRFYVRNRDIILRIGEGAEDTLIDATGTEALDIDVVGKSDSVLARYAGIQAINRDLSLPFLADANTVLCYDGTLGTVAVTEALPPGVVSWWTFDTADFSGNNAVDLVSGNTATLVGTAPVSVAGQINQARQFLTGTGNGHYSAANPVNLRITGNLSLAYWLKRTTAQDYHHPIHKAFGGEYSTIIYADGSGYFYYGTSGGNTSPYFGYFLPPGTFPVGEWFHGVVTRDFTNKIVRYYVNKRLVMQKPTIGTAAVSGSLSVELGNATPWTNTRLAGQLDEVIIANQAWSPETVAALYDKGAVGIKANVSGGGSAQRLVDSGPGARHAFTPFSALLAPAGGGLTTLADKNQSLLAGGSSYPGTVAFTIEALIKPRWSETAERAVFSNRVDLSSSSSGSRTQGAVEFAYTPDGMILFRFDTASVTVELRQTGGVRLRMAEKNHIAVTHTFGFGGSSMLVVNGSPVPARWVGGSGSEIPTLLTAAPSVRINPGDEVMGLRVSNVARTIADLRNYLRGRS